MLNNKLLSDIFDLCLSIRELDNLEKPIFDIIEQLKTTLESYNKLVKENKNTSLICQFIDEKIINFQSYIEKCDGTNVIRCFEYLKNNEHNYFDYDPELIELYRRIIEDNNVILYIRSKHDSFGNILGLIKQFVIIRNHYHDGNIEQLTMQKPIHMRVSNLVNPDCLLNDGTIIKLFHKEIDIGCQGTSRWNQNISIYVQILNGPKYDDYVASVIRSISMFIEDSSFESIKLLTHTRMDNHRNRILNKIFCANIDIFSGRGICSLKCLKEYTHTQDGKRLNPHFSFYRDGSQHLDLFKIIDYLRRETSRKRRDEEVEELKEIPPIINNNNAINRDTFEASIKKINDLEILVNNQNIIIRDISELLTKYMVTSNNNFNEIKNMLTLKKIDICKRCNLGRTNQNILLNCGCINKYCDSCLIDIRVIIEDECVFVCVHCNKSTTEIIIVNN